MVVILSIKGRKEKGGKREKKEEGGASGGKLERAHLPKKKKRKKKPVCGDLTHFQLSGGVGCRGKEEKREKGAVIVSTNRAKSRPACRFPSSAT